MHYEIIMYSLLSITFFFYITSRDMCNIMSDAMLMAQEFGIIRKVALFTDLLKLPELEIF